MFGVGTPEVIGIIVITLLIYGPDRLPEIIKKVVGFIRSIKNMTDEVSNTVSKEIHRIERSTGIQEAKHLIQENTNILNQSTHQIQRDLKKPIQPIHDTSHDQTIINDSNKEDEPSN